MNFSPFARSWIILVCTAVSTGGIAGMTAFVGGSSWPLALISGFISSAGAIGHNLMMSPKAKAEEAITKDPFPINPAPKVP